MCDRRAEGEHPAPDALGRDHNAPLGQQLFDPLTGLHGLFASRPQPCDFKASCSPSHVRKERTVLSKTTWPKGPEKGTAAPGVGAQDGGWTTEAASTATSCGTVLRLHSRIKPEDRQELVPHPTTKRRARRPCISCRPRHYQPADARPRGRRGEADRNGGHLANAFQDLSRSNYSVHGWVRIKKA